MVAPAVDFLPRVRGAGRDEDLAAGRDGADGDTVPSSLPSPVRQQLLAGLRVEGGHGRLLAALAAEDLAVQHRQAGARGISPLGLERMLPQLLAGGGVEHHDGRLLVLALPEEEPCRRRTSARSCSRRTAPLYSQAKRPVCGVEGQDRPRVVDVDEDLAAATVTPAPASEEASPSSRYDQTSLKGGLIESSRTHQ